MKPCYGNGKVPTTGGAPYRVHNALVFETRQLDPYTDTELATFREGLADLGFSHDQLTACLGGACYDVFLCDLASWRCGPARVRKCAKAASR